MSQRESVRIRSSSFFRYGVIGYEKPDLLVEVAVVDLDVARLVEHLRRRVVLRVHVGHGVDELRGREQRALLAVQELREDPAEHLDAETASFSLSVSFA